MNKIKDLSVVHHKYKEKDPRTLPYLFPDSLNIVSYAKNVQVYTLFNTLDVAENIAKRFNHILIPSKCMHWNRIKQYQDRKIRIGRRNFYLMQPEEMTELEKEKFLMYIEDLQQSSIYDHRS